MKIAVFMPMTCPFMLSSGPPEFPGLIAASVCKKLPKLVMFRLPRPLAEMIPKDSWFLNQMELLVRERIDLLGPFLSRRDIAVKAAAFEFFIDDLDDSDIRIGVST